MARIKLFLAFIALIILGAGVVAAAYYWKKYGRPNWEVTRGLENPDKNGNRKGPDLGLREYDAAIDLLKEGELQGARDRLYYLMQYYPESASHKEAKRIIGEINLDLLVSRLPIEGKSEHVVKSGDLLQPIARKNQCTIDYIMRASGKTTPVIYPDDHLVVYPLNFKVDIDLSDRTVTIRREDGTFFKEYAIRSTNIPQVLKPPATTEISEKVAWHEGRPVNFTSRNYLQCSKWIRTKKMGLFIRMASPEDSDDGDENGDSNAGSSSNTNFGVMVDRADIEEMFTILRNGTPVSLTE